jgi:hypothetical protein
VARVYEQRGFWKLTRILGISRDLSWGRVRVRVESEMNWKTISSPDQYILRPMCCHRLLSRSLCSKTHRYRRGFYSQRGSGHKRGADCS